MVHLTTALDAASGVPLYEQLYRSLTAEMRTGAISAGTRMPGKRRLAAELSVSVNTVDAAYQMLAAEGYLEARERSGFYVQEYLALPERTESAAPPQPEAAPAPEQPVRYDLSTRGVDPELFTLVKNQMYGEMLADVENVDDAAEEMGMAFLKGRTLADEIEALAALTVDDVNKALQTMLLEENSAYIQIDPKE
jgi:DNA-binding transcriptional MocR family regulator